jgi:hypothetical protein
VWNNISENNRRLPLLFLFIVWMQFVLPVVSPAAQVLKIPTHEDKFILGNFLDVYEDRSAKQSLDEVMKNAPFLPLGKDVANYMFSRSAFWLRGMVANNGEVAEKFILEVDNPFLNYIELHIFRDGGVHEVTKAGNRQPFFSRGITANNFAFPLPLRPGEKAEILVRVQSNYALFCRLFFGGTVLFNRTFCGSLLFSASYWE